MSWRATDLAEDDARQHAADLNVTFNQSGNATKPIAEKSAADRSGISHTVHSRRSRLLGDIERQEWWGSRTPSRRT
jgi:hypothetical protein